MNEKSTAQELRRSAKELADYRGIRIRQRGMRRGDAILAIKFCERPRRNDYAMRQDGRGHIAIHLGTRA